MRRLGALLAVHRPPRRARSSGSRRTPGARPAASLGPPTALSWRETVVDADQSFRGLDAVDRRTAWVTGGSATEGGPGRVFRTTDGGRTWQDVSPPGTEGLLFRDVEARSATRRRDPRHRAGRRVADLPHHRRRRDLGRGLPSTTTRRRSTTAWRSTPAAGTAWRERPGRREVPDPRHRRLRPLVDGPPDDGMPAAPTRVRLRRQRRLPRHRRTRRTSAPAVAPRRLPSTTAA